jgi:FdhD protein
VSIERSPMVPRRIARIRGGDVEDIDDVVAGEEPLELQVAGFDGPYRSVAVVMRTPDDDGEADLDLAVGFLHTEGVIASVDDVSQLAACTTPPSPEADGNVVQVRLARGVELDWRRLTRHVFSASSCGVCGKASLDAIAAALPAGRVGSTVAVRATALQALVVALRARQSVFAATGGTHGAMLAGAEGDVRCVREDVGRHNALDKAIGHALRARMPLQEAVVVVTGRIAFELVQKCAAAGIGLIAGVGAPTSLAVELGARTGVTVVGFVGPRGMNVYSGFDRVRAGG